MTIGDPLRPGPTLNDLIAKATIELEEPLNLKQAEALLLYIAERLPADVNYVITAHRNITANKGYVNLEQGTLKIDGQIHHRKEPLLIDSFETEPDQEETGKIKKLRFFLIPGLDSVEEYGPEKQKLWDYVRKAVTQYFMAEKE
jgi:hypothetical protein